LRLVAALAWRNLWRNPRRTVITLIVVAAGLYSILSLGALLEAWARSSRDSAINLMTGSGEIHASGYLDDPSVASRMAPPDPELQAVLDRAPIRAWVERVLVPAVVQSEYKTLPLTLVGVDPAGEEQVSTIPKQIADGHYLDKADDARIVLGRNAARRLKTAVGRRVIIMAQAADGSLAEKSFEVAGLFAGSTEAEDAFAFTGIETAQHMLGIGNDISEISFIVPQDASLEGALTTLRDAAPTLDVKPWTTLSPIAAAMNGFMNSFVYIWLWIMSVLMAIGIVNTQLMSVFERVREFGLLQALGMRPRQVLAQVALESAMLVGIGAVIGMAGAALTIMALSRGVDLGFLARGAEFFGASRVLYPHLSAAQFAGFSVLIWALGVVVSLWPAQRAAHCNPVEAMSHES
jgi:ABC-type lipoprotein release transport system permease subunit